MTDVVRTKCVFHVYSMDLKSLVSGKGGIVFVRSKQHSVEEVVEFAGVSHSTVKRMFQQWK